MQDAMLRPFMYSIYWFVYTCHVFYIVYTLFIHCHVLSMVLWLNLELAYYHDKLYYPTHVSLLPLWRWL